MVKSRNKIVLSFVLGMLFFQCSINNNPLKKKWNGMEYNDELQLMLNNNIISNSQYLKYITYPYSEDEFKNYNYEKVFMQIDSKSQLLDDIEIVKCLDNLICAHTIGFSKSNKNHMLQTTVLFSNGSNKNQRLDQLSLIIHLSKFQIIVEYYYDNIDDFILENGQKIEQEFYFPKEEIDFALREIGAVPEDDFYNLLRVSINNLNFSLSN